MALPALYIHGQYTKTRLKMNARGDLAVYSVRRKNTSSHPTFELVNASFVYPEKYGIHLQGFSRLYDALTRYHDLNGRTPLSVITPLTPNFQVQPPPQIKVDGMTRGGSNGGR